MKLAVYRAPDEFLQASQDELARQEAGNNLMLGLALRIQKAPERFKRPAFFATVAAQSGPAPLMAAIMTPPGNLHLYSVHDDMESAAALVAGELHAHGWPVPGVVGSAHVGKQFAEAWTRLTGLPHRQTMAHGIFELRTVSPHPAGPGGLRAARADEAALLTKWTCDFQKEALFHTADPLEAREALELRIEDGDVFVWETGRPVSMAVRSRPTLTGISIGSVYTPPEWRGKGYASACVAALSQMCLDSGFQFCMLYTDLSNPTSNRIYQKIGYRPIGESREYRFGEAHS